MTRRIESLAYAVLAVTALLRFPFALRRALGDGRWPDVDNYFSIARAMTHPFDTNVRESPWIWIAWFCQKLGNGGREDLLLGIVGLFLLGLTAFFLFKGVKQLTNFLTAFLATLLFLNNGLLLEIATHGTRDVLFLLAVVLLTYFAWARLPKEKHRLIGLTVASMLAVGARSTTFPLLALVLVIAAIKNQRRWSLLFVPWTAAFLFMLPYLLYCHHNYADVFYSANVHAAWWRNHEFLTYNPIGCEGCGKLQDGAYSGKPTTWFHYIFGQHQLSEVIYWTVDGIWNLTLKPGIYLRSMAGAVVWPLYLVYYLGLGIALRSANRILLLFPLLFVNLLFFTFHLQMDTRLFSPLIPFLTTIHAIGLAYLLVWITAVLPRFFARRAETCSSL